MIRVRRLLEEVGRGLGAPVDPASPRLASRDDAAGGRVLAAERRPPGAAHRRGERGRDPRRAGARGRPHRPPRPPGRAPAGAGRDPLLADRARPRIDPRAGPGPRGALRQSRAPGPRRGELRRDPACTWPSCRCEARPLRAAVGILHWRGELERRIAGFLDQRRSTRTRTSRWLAATRRLDVSRRRVRRLGDAADRRRRETGSTARDLLTARDRIRARARRPAATDDAGPCRGARRPAHGRGADPSLGLDAEAGCQGQSRRRDR